MLWSWALAAIFLPVFGGGYIECLGARPDVFLAFMIAAALKRYRLVHTLCVFIALCFVRYWLSPPDSRGECLGLLIIAAGLPLGVRVFPRAGRIGPAVTAAVAFACLVFFALFLQKGQGGAAPLPPEWSLGLTFLYTAAYAVAFALLLPRPRGGV